MAKQTAPVRPDLHLDDLSPIHTLATAETYDGARLIGPHGTLVARDARLLECEVADVSADTLDLRGAHLADVRLTRVRATSILLSGAQIRDVVITDSRIGVLDLSASQIQRLEISAAKADWLNLRAAKAKDVTLIDVRIGDLDLGGAHAAWAAVAGEIEVLHLHEGRYDHVDITKAALTRVDGLAWLRGLVVSDDQARALGPAMARHLGAIVTETE